MSLKREGGISLETSQWKRASSRVEGRISLFFSSCGCKHGVPLVLQRGIQGLNRGGLTKVQFPCELQGTSRDSSAITAGAKLLICS